LGNSQSNFQIHGFATSENIAQSFRGGYFFDSHCISHALLGLFMAYLWRQTSSSSDWCTFWLSVFGIEYTYVV